MKSCCWVINRTRNKIKNSKSQGILKKELIKEKGKVCYKCKKQVYYVELEHIIPVCIGGNIVNKSNLNLICLNCHKKKTSIDKRIFNFFKKLGLVIDEKENTISFIQPEDLIGKYEDLFDMIDRIDEVLENYTSWDNYKEVKKINWDGNIK